MTMTMLAFLGRRGRCRRAGGHEFVVGSASGRPLTGTVLGSVPHKIVHRPTVRVLVVPTSGD
jgi:hypothetical protein